jgi:hypothetical protein
MTYEQQVWNAWTAGVIFFIVVVAFFVLSHRSEDHGPTLFARLLIMFRERQSAPPAAGMNAGNIPVSQYGMEPAGMEDAESGAPDIDAVKSDMASFKRDKTDIEWIAHMAVARGKDNKYRFSANQIHAAVGGDRNAVLATIKELRAVAPPAEYMKPDGTKAPATYPVTGRRSAA